MLNRAISLRYLATVAAIAAAYFAAAKFGFLLAFATKQVTAVWPPTGIALTAYLVLGLRVWPGVYLGALAANAVSDEPLITAAGIAVGNTLQGIVGVLLLRYFVEFDRTLERLRDVSGSQRSNAT
jgi:integral membrane sensor domain MASE1